MRGWNPSVVGLYLAGANTVDHSPYVEVSV